MQNNSNLWENIKNLANNAGTTVDSGLSSAYQFFQVALSGVNTIADAVANIGAGAVGLNVEGLTKLRTDIQTAVNDLDAKISQIAQNTDPTTAFKGEYVEGIKNYIETVKNVCKSVNSQLLYFSDRLAVIQENVTTRQSTINTAINSDSQVLNDESIEDYQVKY